MEKRVATGYRERPIERLSAARRAARAREERKTRKSTKQHIGRVVKLLMDETAIIKNEAD